MKGMRGWIAVRIETRDDENGKGCLSIYLLNGYVRAPVIRSVTERSR